MKSLLIALSLLAVATSASAECAWVLWYETRMHSIYANPQNNTSYHSWDFVGAYPTASACERQQAAKIDDMLKSWRKRKAESAKDGLETTIEYQPGGNIISQNHAQKDPEYYGRESLRYVCLPDTVDPRGPKGK